MLRIASYNIHRCVGADGRQDAQRVWDVVAQLDAHMVGLQEVENEPDAPEAKPQFLQLAEAAGYIAVPGPTLMRGDASYGNALLTRWAPLSVERHVLSVADREPRGLLDVVMDCAGLRLRVMVTHLGLGLGERRIQLQRLIALLGTEHAELPTVLLGDLNVVTRWGGAFRRLTARFDAASVPATFPSWFPVMGLDRILARPGGLVSNIRVVRHARARRASDHLPLVAELDAERP